MKYRTTSPVVVVDQLLAIGLSDLKRIGLLSTGGTYREMPVVISKAGIVSKTQSSMNIAVSTAGVNPFIKFEYELDGVPVSYQVQMVQVKSNLGKGNLWYCLCPITGDRCRKLYLSERFFAGRKAIDGGYYSKQLTPKSRIYISQVMAKVYANEKLVASRDKKYYKSHYQGDLTKRELKVREACSELRSLCN